jgi:curved DNA-binding protein CbpA
VSIPDPYKVLQVDPEAEDEVIEAAYKRLARKYHPDVSPDPGSVERMVRINQAWEMLRDPIRRAAVDRARSRAAATSARVVAADGKAQAAARPTTTPAPNPATAPAPDSGPRHAPAPEWPIPGMQEPAAGVFVRGAGVSPNWTPGRSHEGSGFDARTMGAGSAGPPPGNPSGSIVTFGRYTGWTLGEIARTDPGYLEWLDRMPIGRMYQAEIDAFLRARGLRRSARTDKESGRGIFRRR